MWEISSFTQAFLTWLKCCWIFSYCHGVFHEESALHQSGYASLDRPPFPLSCKSYKIIFLPTFTWSQCNTWRRVILLVLHFQRTLCAFLCRPSDSWVWPLCQMARVFTTRPPPWHRRGFSWAPPAPLFFVLMPEISFCFIEKFASLDESANTSMITSSQWQTGIGFVLWFWKPPIPETGSPWNCCCWSRFDLSVQQLTRICLECWPE